MAKQELTKSVNQSKIYDPICVHGFHDKYNIESNSGDYQRVSSKYSTLYPYFKVFKVDCFSFLKIPRNRSDLSIPHPAIHTLLRQEVMVMA